LVLGWKNKVFLYETKTAAVLTTIFSKNFVFTALLAARAMGRTIILAVTLQKIVASLIWICEKLNARLI
jgi:hypothetical protein